MDARRETMRASESEGEIHASSVSLGSYLEAGASKTFSESPVVDIARNTDFSSTARERFGTIHFG